MIFRSDAESKNDALLAIKPLDYGFELLSVLRLRWQPPQHGLLGELCLRWQPPHYVYTVSYYSTERWIRFFYQDESHTLSIGPSAPPEIRDPAMRALAAAVLAAGARPKLSTQDWEKQYFDTADVPGGQPPCVLRRAFCLLGVLKVFRHLLSAR